MTPHRARQRWSNIPRHRDAALSYDFQRAVFCYYASARVASSIYDGCRAAAHDRRIASGDEDVAFRAATAEINYRAFTSPRGLPASHSAHTIR